MDDETNFDILKEKVDAGADFIVTQLFYDASRFLEWLERVRLHGLSVFISGTTYSPTILRYSCTHYTWRNANTDILLIPASGKPL